MPADDRASSTSRTRIGRPSTRRRRAYLVLSALAVLVLSASPASAESPLPPGLPSPTGPNVYEGPEPTFKGEIPPVSDALPEPEVRLPGEASPTIAEKEGFGQWTCNDAWDIITNYASGVLIGNCARGTWMNRTKYSGPNAQGVTFSGGYIAGSYNGCGWVEDRHITYRNGNHYTGCSNPNTKWGKIGYAYNSATQGGPTYVTSRNPGCQLYANVHPWQNPPVVTDPLTGALPTGTRLDWRYIVGYGPNQPHKDSRYGDYWVAVLDYAGYGGASWVFAPFYGCFQPPNGEPVYLPPGEGGYWFPNE
jgi:hypothetical protein